MVINNKEKEDGNQSLDIGRWVFDIERSILGRWTLTRMEN